MFQWIMVVCNPYHCENKAHHGACGACTPGQTCCKSSVNVESWSSSVRTQGEKIWNQTLGNFEENWILVLFKLKLALFWLN